MKIDNPESKLVTFYKDEFVNLKDPDSITVEHVIRDTNNHIHGVKSIADFLLAFAHKQINRHDETKIGMPLEFTRYLQNVGYGRSDEKDPDTGKNWFNDTHVIKERHHLNDHVPEDVNLIDVLEMVADCTTAGLQRSGGVRPVKISNEVLQKAIENTVKLIIDNTMVVGVDSGE